MQNRSDAGVTMQRSRMIAEIRNGKPLCYCGKRMTIDRGNYRCLRCDQLDSWHRRTFRDEEESEGGVPDGESEC